MVTSPQRPQGEPEPTILVIDDEPANLQLIKMAVTREQFRCNLVLCVSARDGLEYLEQHPAHLILLDVVMPGMNGFEMFSQLKADPRWADVPVIFLSAVNEPQYIIQGLEMGAADYIGKPLIAQVLTARFRSVLRMKHLQAELKHRNVELENANRLKDEFLSFCSHDLRAPISAIELTCQFLDDQLGEAPEAEQRETIARIVNQTRLARRLVESLLDMNKIEEGRVIPQPTFFSPNDLLDGCVRDHQPMILAKALKLTVEPHGEDAVCFGDREMIAQTVRNVLGNAVKFANTRVRVTSRIEPGAVDTGGFWRLAIADDGTGIPPGEEETIFNKYAKSDLRDAGYGLGLYIAKQTVSLHRGSITAASPEGEDTYISIRLPFAFPREALPDLAGAGQASVRIVTAARETAELLETILLEGGLVHVSGGPSHANALDEIASHPPSVAIVDLASDPVDFLRLMKMIGNGQGPTRWMLIGAPDELETLRRHLPPSTALLEMPINPLLCLRRVGDLCERRASPLLAAR
jgi:two-component system sensor histidine kinase/response regulator